MKKAGLFFAGLFLLFNSFAQKSISYEIVKADIYLRGAKIHSQSNVELAKGQHTLFISNISDYANLNNIQAKVVSSGAKLISVNATRDFMNANELSARGKELTEKREQLAQQIKILTIENDVIRDEINLIHTLITKKSGDEKTSGYTAVQLEELSSFYGSKVLELKKKSYDIELKLSKSNDELNRVNAQINEEAINKNKNKQVVEVIVEVSTPGNKTIELNYFINECGWIPSYDVKADNKDKPIEIIYKASVWQRSGIDWKDTEVTLMTNQPVANQNRPILSPLYVDFTSQQSIINGVRTRQASPIAEESYSNMLEMSMSKMADESPYDAVAYASDINMSYQVNGKIAVTGDGKAKMLTLDSKKVNGRFVYHAVPKINEQVYLIAYISEWHKLNLINGSASIYLQDIFIGHVFINEKFTGDEYPLSFGVDNRLAIKRNKTQDINNESKIGNEKKERISFEITVRNNLGSDIEVEILDQVPVSRDKNLKIILENYGNAEYTPEIGLLKWLLPVKGGQSGLVKFNYEIRYPKENALNYHY